MANGHRKQVGAARRVSFAVVFAVVFAVIFGGTAGLPQREGEPVAAAEEAHAPPPIAGAARLPTPESLPAGPLLDAQLFDLEDHPVSLRALHGKVVVVLHQDRYSSEQNPAFKDSLGELGRRHPATLKLIALAEVGSYNFWPARRYVKDALRPLQLLGGAVVACDWKAAVQKQYHIPPRQSAVFVVGKTGALQVMTTGVLTAARTATLLRQIEELAVD